jgi:hypothetical protein
VEVTVAAGAAVAHDVEAVAAGVGTLGLAIAEEALQATK